MGFIVFGIGPTYGGLYEALREQISSALKRIQLHRDVVTAQRLAEEANTLKSRFLSTVTHELRTPLSTIVSLSEMLLKDIDVGESHQPGRYRQHLESIHAVGQHLDRLVLDVLDLGRSQLGQLKIELKTLDLGALLRDSTIKHRTFDIFPEAQSFREDEQSLSVLSIREVALLDKRWQQ